MQIHAGVRALRDHELQVKLDVAKLFIGDEINRPAIRTIQHLSTRLWIPRNQARWTQQPFPKDAAHSHPIVLRLRIRSMPTRQILAIEQWPPPGLNEVRSVTMRIAVGDDAR